VRNSLRGYTLCYMVKACVRLLPTRGDSKAVLAPNVMVFRDVPSWISDLKTINFTHLVLQYPEIFQDPEDYYILDPPPVLTARGLYMKAPLARIDDYSALMFVYRAYKNDLVLLHLERYSKWDSFEKASRAVRLISPNDLVQKNSRFKKAAILLKARERDSVYWPQENVNSTDDNTQFSLIHVLYALQDRHFKLIHRTCTDHVPPIVAIFEVDGFCIVHGVFKDFVPWVLSACGDLYETHTALFEDINREKKRFLFSNTIRDLKKCSTGCKHPQRPVVKVRRRPGKWFITENTTLQYQETFLGPSKVFYTLSIFYQQPEARKSSVIHIGEWKRKLNQVVRRSWESTGLR
jgi:hypothetical protein